LAEGGEGERGLEDGLKAKDLGPLVFRSMSDASVSQATHSMDRRADVVCSHLSGEGRIICWRHE
jgi:hypothetical protein